MTPKNLEDLYVHQLRDLYSAESLIIDALPRMARKASNPQLKRAFETHLEESEQQKERLEQIFNQMDLSPKGETCKAMKGLVAEAEDFIDEAKKLFGSDSPSAVLDAGLIAEAQRVEHYEISAYGTVATYAETLNRTADHQLLAATLAEEKETDQKLSDLAKSMVNPAAVTA
jgi:ferritin-like metal-binding protein YciE